MEKEENINSIYKINKNTEWICEKCQNYNTINDFCCLKCNYFNYDVYSGNYTKQNKKEESKENDIKYKNSVEEPIFLDDKFMDYNFKEEYEFRRQEKHKFNKCWKCGKENIYYKVKCSFCRFPINDTQIPKIKKTQLSQYDLLHNINFDKKNKKKEEVDKYKNIEIKYNNPIKEELNYKNLGNNWICKFCNKFNKETIKYCEFCFKNRL